MNLILAIAGGGAAGAVLRHFFNNALTAWLGGGFPWGIFAANVLGSFIMGVLVSFFAQAWDPPQEIRAFLTVGLLGAFTTFSAFSLDAVMLVERGAWVSASFYTAGSVFFAIAGLYAGMAAVRIFFA